METETPATGPWRYFAAGLLLAVLLLYGPALGFGTGADRGRRPAGTAVGPQS